jgi:hypothetical protein
MFVDPGYIKPFSTSRDVPHPNQKISDVELLALLSTSFNI